MLLFANVKKELLLLSRDRAGLLVLFVMPMMLVLVLSLIQDNLFRATGESATLALFVNLDQGALGAEFGAQIEATGAIELADEFDGESIDAETARQMVFSGDYQFAIIVPAQFSAGINAAAEDAVLASFRDEKSDLPASRLTVYFDPTVRGVYRTAIMNALHRGVLGLEIGRKSEAFGRLLPDELQRSLDEQLAAYGAGGLPLELPQISSDWAGQTLIELKEESAYPEKYMTMPTSVQQNVPAWTLFGMFFIVIPLAGTLIRERQEGTLTRLMTMPVGSISLLLGKVFAYLSICLVQFGLMLVVGKFILPLLGTPVLELGSAPLALLVVAVSAALAACGYGILVGVLARSYDQASTFGAVSVVIAAAMGGVMVPVYVMPRVMQELSVVSPLGWGLDAFLEIFVREGNLSSVMPRIAALVGFFLVCIVFALLVFKRWRRGV
jgi:ABC-2 type transport system permease protein